jgi:hypothetical protein
MEPYIVDIDDFSERNNGELLLIRIKTMVPSFKATLFTPVGLSSLYFIEAMRKRFTWLDLAPHGLYHDPITECLNWTREDCARCLDLSESMGLTRGFRAPGWRLSPVGYLELQRRGYWVADKPENSGVRPEGMKCYFVDSPNKFHFHVQNNKFHNGLEESMEQILALDRTRDFAFIRDLF